MNKKKKKKNKQIKVENVLLDTSIQIRKIFNSSLANELIKLKSEGKELSSSFFVLYEFKAGFIATLIEYYLFIKLHTKFPESIGEWSTSFKPRHLKFTTILDSVILRIDSISNDKAKYLNQVEAAICLLSSNFETDLGKIVGDFQTDEIVEYKISSKDDFAGFMKKRAERKNCIPMIDFWTNHNEDLKRMIVSGDADYNTPGLKKIYDRLVRIDGDLSECNKQRTNNGIGDAVITADCPKRYTLASLDHSFEVLCKKVDKKYSKFS